MPDPHTNKRRLALKALGGSALAGGLADKLPAVWQRPIVQGSLLPAHAQTTSVQGQVQIGIRDTNTDDILSTGSIVYTLSIDSNGQITHLRIPSGSVIAQHPAMANALFPAAYAQQVITFQVMEALTLTFTSNSRQTFGILRITFSFAGDDPIGCSFVIRVELNDNRRSISRLTGSLGTCVTHPYQIRPVLGPDSNFDAIHSEPTAPPTMAVDPTGFMTVWQIEADNRQLIIPIALSRTYAYNVDWGDGSTDVTVFTGEARHIYAEAGMYTVTIRGTFSGIQLHNGTSPHSSAGQLREITQWGTDTEWRSMENTFREVENLEITATDAPDLRQVTNCNNMFQGSGVTATNLNWDVSNVQNMQHMFLDAAAFNGDISDWNVFRVINMRGMFSGAAAFNSDISRWNVSNVTDMEGMFEGATSFNQNINAGENNQWNVSSVTGMARMFQGATMFDQNIGNWDISSVQDMTDMFEGVTLSPANYDALLTGWAGLTSLNNVGVFNGGNSITTSVNSDAYRARLLLASGSSWTITDGYGSLVEVGEIRLDATLISVDSAGIRTPFNTLDNLLRYEIRRMEDGSITSVTFPVGSLSSVSDPTIIAASQLELTEVLTLDFGSGVEQRGALELNAGGDQCESFMITVILLPDRSAIHRINGSDMENCDGGIASYTIQPDMDPNSGFGILNTTPMPTTPAPTTT